ncbi:hypothetical protein [Natronorubrum sp. A-ect3]|uniref:hypothetical protein n=1 Tax=Natronorubrum sp. A-ect3 TaxID=3242698 RepID=UPI00359D4EB9
MGLGAASIGAGALISTGAFSSLETGRGVAVSAADNKQDALLGIDDSTSTEPVFTNNTSLYMDVTLEESDDSINLDFEKRNFNLTEYGSEEDSKSIKIESNDTSVAPVKITVHIYESESGPKKGQIVIQEEFSAVQAEQAEVTGEVIPTGGSGLITFTLENTGDIDIVLEAIGIRNSTNDSITRVHDGELLGIPGSGQGRNIDRVVEDVDEIPIDDSTLVDFLVSEDLELSPGDDVELRFDDFDGDPRGATITVELTFQDTSGDTFELQID